MTILFNDFETRSRANIKKVGARRYARDPSTRVLMNAYAFDDGPVQQWVPAEGQPMPKDLLEAIRDPHVIKRAWNAQFECAVWEACLDEIIDYYEWRCTMVHAYTLSMPGQLGKTGAVLGLPDDKTKDKRGSRLIDIFCKPRTRRTKNLPWEWNTYITHPEEWEEFKSYNRQDIVAEREIYKIIRKWNPPRHEWDLWALDQEINKDGIPINPKVVERAIAFTEYIREKKYARIKEITGVENPRSGPQLLEWLWDNGYRFDDLKKGHVERARDDKHSNRYDVKEVLALRAEVAKTSPDKYYAMERAIDPERDVIQGCLQFAGAQRTARWSGRIIQPQNLARPHPELEKYQADCVRQLETMDIRSLELIYDKGPTSGAAGPMDFLATCIRPTIQAPDGHMIFSADLNAIENRVLGYLAQDQKILDVFRKGRDPYIDFATYMYGEDYDVLAAQVAAGDKSKRTVAKPGVLGCGYMLSAGEEKENKKTGEMEATGLLGYAWNMGVKLTAEQAEDSVRVWRATFEDAVKFWWEIDEAAKKCVRKGVETEAGPVRFDRSGPFMRMWLPSGRALHYVRPRLEASILYWCDVKRKYLPIHMCQKPDKSKYREKESLTYEGLNDKNHWGRIYTHPGKLTENADQAISRDLLAEAMMRFRKRCPRSEGKIRLHVHDEIVGIGPERFAERNLKLLEECMSEPMPWATEWELPLMAKGSLARVWIKD